VIEAIAKLEGVPSSEIILIVDKQPLSKGKLFTFKDYDQQD